MGLEQPETCRPKAKAKAAWESGRSLCEPGGYQVRDVRLRMKGIGDTREAVMIQNNEGDERQRQCEAPRDKKETVAGIYQQPRHSGTSFVLKT